MPDLSLDVVPDRLAVIMENFSNNSAGFSAKFLCQKILDCVVYEKQHKHFGNRAYYQPYIPKPNLNDLLIATQALKQFGYRVHTEIPKDPESDGTFRCTIQITWEG